MITSSEIRRAIQAVRDLMEEKQDYLIEIDGVIGDGDLGLTMTKAFRAGYDAISDADDTDVGALLIKAGMAMAKAAPSTMGSLVATGFLRAGKAAKGKTQLMASDLADVFRAFSDGIIERGKTKPGNKTIVDVMDPVATALEAAAEEGLDAAAIAKRAVDAAETGAADAKEMMSQHGKAAVFREKTIGKPDPGATAGALIVRGFFSVIG